MNIYILQERYFKPTKDYYDLLLPATLLQVDDFEIENRVNGLKILKQILAASVSLWASIIIYRCSFDEPYSDSFLVLSIGKLINL